MIIRINASSILRKVDKAAEVKGRPIAYKKAYALYYRSKSMMLKEYDKHPVTAEIAAGPMTLPATNATGGYGNLYAFLGFKSGTKPTQELRELIEEQTQFHTVGYRNKAFHFRIALPSKGTIEAMTEMPWGTGGSWVHAVEHGLDNLAFFVYKRSMGRSGGGIIAADEVNDDLSFQTQPYLTTILANFRKRVNNSTVNEA
jgi:hypothetical protein